MEAKKELDVRRCITILTTVLVFTSSIALAGPLAKTHISADADWVVHINNAQFARTQIGKMIRAELGALGIEEKLGGFSAIFGFHPIDDLRNITIYGTGTDESKAVALAQGKFDPDQLIALVTMNPMYEEIPHGDSIVHKWRDDENTDEHGNQKIMFGCIHKNKTVILGRGLDTVRKAVDVLDGSADNAADSLNLPALKAKGAFIQIAGKNIARMAAQQGQAAMLKQAESISLAVGEVDSKFYATVSLIANNPEAAQAIGKMADGIIAFMSLARQEQPQLAQIANAMKLSYKDNRVSMRLEVDSNKVMAFLKEQWQKEAEKKKASQQQ